MDLQYNIYIKGIFIGVISIISYYHVPTFYKFLKTKSISFVPEKKQEKKEKQIQYYTDYYSDSDDEYFKDGYSFGLPEIPSDDENFDDEYPIGLPIEHLYYRDDVKKYY
jgi:hypothetical protein